MMLCGSTASTSTSGGSGGRPRSSCHASTRPVCALVPRPANQQAFQCQAGSLNSTFANAPVVASHRSGLANRDRSSACHAFDPKDNKDVGKSVALQLNPAYVAICGGFALLFLFRNPYIFAGLTILTIIPQNSAVTSLNSLVLLFYDSGLFMNFAEAVYCVRLISWVSIACTLISFAIFA